jgi:hypothetical protein
MDAKEYLNTHYYGIDVNIDKPIILTVEQLLEIMNNFKNKSSKNSRKLANIAISKGIGGHPKNAKYFDNYDKIIKTLYEYNKLISTTEA